MEKYTHCGVLAGQNDDAYCHAPARNWGREVSFSLLFGEWQTESEPGFSPDADAQESERAVDIQGEEDGDGGGNAPDASPDADAQEKNGAVDMEGEDEDEKKLRAEYRMLIKTKFKKFYTEDTQRMLNRRFRKYREQNGGENRGGQTAGQAAGQAMGQVMEKAPGQAVGADTVGKVGATGLGNGGESAIAIDIAIADKVDATGVGVGAVDSVRNGSAVCKVDATAVGNGGESAIAIDNPVYAAHIPPVFRPPENGNLRSANPKRRGVKSLSRNERAEIARRALSGEKVML